MEIPASSLESFIRSTRRVATYAGISIFEAMQLPHDFFLLCYKEAYVENQMQSPEGREQLRTAWRLQQTRPDYDKLARLPGYTKEVIPDDSRA